MTRLFVGRVLEQLAAAGPAGDRPVMTSTIVSFALGEPRGRGHGPAPDDAAGRAAHQLGSTATKEGCRQGGCGSCTVLVDGEPMLSCLLPVEDVAGRRVTTLEGLTPTEGLHPIQQAFLDGGAFQCGYCTPGMIMVAKALLDRDPAPTPTRSSTRWPATSAAAPATGRSSRRSRTPRPRRSARPTPPSPTAMTRRSTSSAGRSARSDGIGHVTGRTQFTADRMFPGMLHLKMVRSPVHHARIRGIDLSEAERVPGLRPRPDRRGRAAQRATRSWGSSASSPRRSSCWPRSASGSRARRSPRSLPRPRQAALEAVAAGPPRPRGAAGGLRRRGGARPARRS